jgi:hypothetical protein
MVAPRISGCVLLSLLVCAQVAFANPPEGAGRSVDHARLNQLYANGCRLEDETTSCDLLYLEDSFSEDGRYRLTVVWIRQSLASPSLFADRDLTCWVGENVDGARELLSGNVRLARVADTTLNDAGSFCVTDGKKFTYDPVTGWSYEPWGFYGPVVIAAEWRVPERIERSVSAVATTQSGVSGTAHHNCHTESAWGSSAKMWIDGRLIPLPGSESVPSSIGFTDCTSIGGTP